MRQGLTGLFIVRFGYGQPTMQDSLYFLAVISLDFVFWFVLIIIFEFQIIVGIN